jgi:hypothetical protein
MVCDRPATVTGTDIGSGMVRETCDEHRPTHNDVADLPWADVVRRARLPQRRPRHEAPRRWRRSKCEPDVDNKKGIVVLDNEAAFVFL